MSKGTKRKKGNKICPEGIAWAKRTFDRYPSAYANMAASKYCKSSYSFLFLDRRALRL